MNNLIKLDLKGAIDKKDYDVFWKYYYDKTAYLAYCFKCITKDLDVGFGRIIVLGDDIMFVGIDSEKKQQIIKEFNKRKAALKKLMNKNYQTFAQGFADYIVDTYFE